MTLPLNEQRRRNIVCLVCELYRSHYSLECRVRNGIVYSRVLNPAHLLYCCLQDLSRDPAQSCIEIVRCSFELRLHAIVEIQGTCIAHLGCPHAHASQPIESRAIRLM